MSVIVALVFDSDATAWAHERGIAESETGDDFAALLGRAVNAGTITAALTAGLDAVLPVLSGHADITVTARSIDGLDATTRDDLLRRLRAARAAEQDLELLADVRHHLGEHLTEHPQQCDELAPRWVIFATQEWDNGHFLTGSDATVYFDDGQHVPVDFHGSRVDELLTAMYGARGATAALGLDLRDGTLEFDDYAGNVLDLLGIPAHRHHTDDGCAIDASDHTVLRNGVDVAITDLRTGDVFDDHDTTPWRATDVGRDGSDVHVDIEPASNQPADPIR